MMFNGCIHNLHLISHFVTASPQGEAYKKIAHFNFFRSLTNFYQISTPRNCFAKIPTINDKTATDTLIVLISKNLGRNFCDFATDI